MPSTLLFTNDGKPKRGFPTLSIAQYKDARMIANCGGNKKLGDDVVQISYIPAINTSIQELIDGADVACCVETCRHRPANDAKGKDTCYVLGGFHSRMALESHVTRSEDFPAVRMEEFRRWLKLRRPELVRFGRYGDPSTHAFSTMYLMETCRRHKIRYTCYTAAWENFYYRMPDKKYTVEKPMEYMAASCNTPAEAAAAVQSGWKTIFYSGSEPPQRPEGGSIRTCPAYRTKNAKTCADCGWCGSKVTAGSKLPRIITIPPHGATVPVASPS